MSGRAAWAGELLRQAGLSLPHLLALSDRCRFRDGAEVFCTSRSPTEPYKNEYQDEIIAWRHCDAVLVVRRVRLVAMPLNALLNLRNRQLL